MMNRHPVHHRRLRASLALLLLSPLAVLAIQGRADASFTSAVVAGTLEISGDTNADSITVTCSSGNVKINSGDPSTGPFPCASLDAITVWGDGGADAINLASVTSASFPSAAVTIWGGGGGDSITASDTADTIRAGKGNDTVNTRFGNDIAFGGKGTDSLQDFGGTNVVLTDTQIVGGFGTDALSGFENAIIFGSAGNDVMETSAWSGSANLYLNAGVDLAQTGPGPDTLSGGPGMDELHGGAGNDVVQGDEDDDTLDGGPGTDTLYEYSGAFVLTNTLLTGTMGTDTHTRMENAKLIADPNATIDASAYDHPTNLQGVSSNETIIGGSKDDELVGDIGNDSLTGNAGDDVIDGGQGIDTCTGGAGTDTLKRCE